MMRGISSPRPYFWPLLRHGDGILLNNGITHRATLTAGDALRSANLCERQIGSYISQLLRAGLHVYFNTLVIMTYINARDRGCAKMFRQ